MAENMSLLFGVWFSGTTIGLVLLRAHYKYAPKEWEQADPLNIYSMIACIILWPAILPLVPIAYLIEKLTDKIADYWKRSDREENPTD